LLLSILEHSKDKLAKSAARIEGETVHEIFANI